MPRDAPRARIWIMNANPFEKTQFECHRDWEESLVEFLSREARNPDIRNWLPFATRHDTRKAVAFSALLLSDLLETRPDFRESADKVYEVYKSLMETEGGARQFEEWLRSGWLNVSRVADLLRAGLRR